VNHPSRRYEIALARPGDLPRIAPIELAAARLLAGHAPEVVLKEVTPVHDLQAAQRHGRLWVALSNDVPVGFALVELLEPDAAHLEEIDVHPDHGRQGLGTRLVGRVCQWAETHRIGAVTLTTFRDVPWNMPFYARLGFEEIAPAALTPALRELRDRLREAVPLVSDGGWPDLSMGMSDDYAVAIEEGATLIRLGRALFGARLSTPGVQ